MRLFINSLASSAGGGLTYIRNVIPHFAGISDLRVTVALPAGVAKEFSSFSNVELLSMKMNALQRFWYEQVSLPGLLRQRRADVLLSAGNFALRHSPVPQILLSRNSIYTSRDFYRDLRSRREYGTWLDTRFRGLLAKKSIHWADVTVAPSAAFAVELGRWTGARVRAIHHGFDREAFARDAGPLPPAVVQELERAGGSLKLLYVSHYNYYRNFETLLRALPLLRRQMAGRSITLFLTCKLIAGENPGTYNPSRAADLIRELGVSDIVVQLGSIPYCQLHHLYRSVDIYVTPAYTETFAHPLVEAMASGLPVVASDLAVHREICGGAAEYFPTFSPDALAEKIAEVTQSPQKLREMAVAGSERSGGFSWKAHVEAILSLCDELMGSHASGNTNRDRFRAIVA